MAQKAIRLSTRVETGANAPANRRNPLGVLSLQAILVLAVVIALVPVAFMVVTSLKTPQQYNIDKLGLPQPLTLESYNEVLTEHPFFLWMLNSAILSAGAVLVS